MPLSAEQKLVLKNSDTKVKFEQENPKTPGSKAYQKGMTSTNQATLLERLHIKEQIGKTSQLILKKDG